MAKYFIRRFIQLVVVAFIISILCFLLVHLLPGDPSAVILGPSDTAHNRAALFKQLGLDKPLYQQYFVWLRAVFHGNLGQSYLDHESVTHIIATGFPIDLELIVISQVIAFAVAIPLALVTSRRPNKALDNVSTTTTFGLLALPPFVIAPIMVAIFAVGLHWFPATGYVPFSQNPAQNLHDMILPSLAITAGSIAVYYRLLRSDLISTLQEDFITMARSKGWRTGPSCGATRSGPHRSRCWPRPGSTSGPCWPGPSSSSTCSPSTGWGTRSSRLSSNGTTWWSRGSPWWWPSPMWSSSSSSTSSSPSSTPE